MTDEERVRNFFYQIKYLTTNQMQVLAEENPDWTVNDGENHYNVWRESQPDIILELHQFFTQGMTNVR